MEKIELKCIFCGKDFIPKSKVHRYCSKKCGKKGYNKNGYEKKIPISQTHPELMKEWDWEKNKELKLDPDKLTYGSSKKAYWICDKNKHKWDNRISKRTIRNYKCPYCSGQKICKDNCLLIINPKLSTEWNYKKNKNLKPQDVMPGSRKKVWWECSKKHKWEAIIDSRNRGNNCPYCSNKKVCKDNCLSTINPELAKEWHPTKNGELTPKDVVAKSGKRVWWICSKGHEWEASMHHRSRKEGSDCHLCSKKNEGKVKILLLKYFKDWVIIPGKKIWDKYKDYNHRRYCDFWLEKDEMKIIVEYDGSQHFKPVTFGGMSFKKAEKAFKQTQLKDKLDTEFCKENQIILHRIKYDEDKEERIKELLKKIKNLN